MILILLTVLISILGGYRIGYGHAVNKCTAVILELNPELRPITGVNYSHFNLSALSELQGSLENVTQFRQTTN